MDFKCGSKYVTYLLSFTSFIFLLDNLVMTTKQRTDLKFLVRLGKYSSEALCMLQQVYQEQTLSRSTVFLWHKRFKEGRENVEDDPRCGRPFTSRNETSQRHGFIMNFAAESDFQSACL